MTEPKADAEIFSLRPMQLEETEKVYRLITVEPWHLLLTKFKAIAERLNCLYVFASAEGTIAGTVSILATHKGECVLGNLVVAKAFRGKGFGGRILARVQELYPDWVITLTAVPGVSAFYSKNGFRDGKQNYTIMWLQVDQTDLEKSDTCPPPTDVIVKPYTSDAFEELCEYENGHRGYDMTQYFSIMIETMPRVLVARQATSGSLVGYVAAFVEDTTLVLDGFFADDDGTALLLYEHILKCFPEKKVVKFQTIKPRMFLAKFGKMVDEETYTRMVNGEYTLSSSAKLYSLTDSDYSV